MLNGAARDAVDHYAFTRTDRGIVIGIMIFCIVGFFAGRHLVTLTVPALVVATMVLWADLTAASIGVAGESPTSGLP